MEYPYVGFDGTTIDLFVANSEKYRDTTLSLVRNLCNERGMYCIYVSANRPKSNLELVLRAGSIRTDLFFFVDCVSKLVANGADGSSDTNNHIYVSTPGNLTDISIAISKGMRHLNGREIFVFVDSLSTLEVYNSATALARFVHFLVTKMRTHGVGGIFLILDGEQDKRLLATLSHYCDRVVATSEAFRNPEVYEEPQLGQQAF